MTSYSSYIPISCFTDVVALPTTKLVDSAVGSLPPLDTVVQYKRIDILKY